jgi:hypothetical protein
VGLYGLKLLIAYILLSARCRTIRTTPNRPVDKVCISSICFPSGGINENEVTPRETFSQKAEIFALKKWYYSMVDVDNAGERNRISSTIADWHVNWATDFMSLMADVKSQLIPTTGDHRTTPVQPACAARTLRPRCT